MRKSYSYLLTALLCSFVVENVAITRDQFFGERTDDTPNLVANDDDSSTEISLSVSYPFFDKPRSVIFVNNNGALSFTERVPMYTNTEFPRNEFQLIAQFWGDVDTRGSGSVWYMETTEEELLNRATDYIRAGFVTERTFRPTHLFIATWDEVGYYDKKSDKTNTFQTILATDSINVYVIFLYADINWTTGDNNMGTNGLGGSPAQVGFNAGDMLNSYSVPGSRTDDIVNIHERSNIGMPGVWVFHVSGATIRSGGCSNVSRPDLTLSPSFGSVLGGETVSVAGPCFNPSDRVQCEFDGIVVSAIFVSSQEVLCVSPQLLRAGRVTFRLLVNGAPLSQKQFMSIPIENAYQVDVQTATDKLAITSNDEIQLRWSPRSIFPRNISSDFQVTIAMYSLNLQNGEWDLLHTFNSNSANDGQETIVIPDNLDPAIEILPIVFHVSASINPVSTIRSGTLYTELVRAGQSAARWSSQYYYFNPLVTTQTGYHLCQSWYEGEPPSTGGRLLEENGPCPPREALARATNSGMEEVDFSSFFGSSDYQRQWLGSFHQGASSCFTQRSMTTSSSQQCCYDNEGDLITGAPNGGSVDKISLAVSRLSHFQEDIRPYLLCCTGYAPSCQKYYEHRPSHDGRGYQAPPPAWIFGDPHLVTLDGHKYTFNGKGEFTLVHTLNRFTLQGRMQQYDNAMATVLTAIAAKEAYSDRVMIAHGRQGIEAYVNGEIVDLRLVRRQTFRNITLVMEDGSDVITAMFSSGVVVSAKSENGFLSAFSVVLPDDYREITQGLLGLFDGDPSNDLRPNNAISSLSLSTEESRVHELFGLTWILTNSQDSLFTYRPYENFNDLRDPDFTPNYSVNSSSADVSACNGDKFCEYDVVTTGNTQVGVATLATVADVQEAVQMSYPVVCEPPCVNGACVANNTCACSTGYTGSLCNSFSDITSCDLNPCSSGEKCAIVAGSYFCTADCEQTQLSPLCLIIPSGPCDINHCNNRGVCRPSNASVYEFECSCPTGYTGRLCDIVVRSPCDDNPCQNGGVCSSSAESETFICTCPEGYTGSTCENGASVQNYIIIGASAAGGLVVAVIVVLLVCIIATVACKKRTKMKSEELHVQAGANKSSTLTKTPAETEGAQQGPNGVYRDIVHVSTPPTNHQSSSQPATPTVHENVYVNQVPLVHEGQQTPGSRDPRQSHDSEPSSAHHQSRNPHDVTPPPPYTDEWQRHNSNQNHNVPADHVQSDSSSMDGSGINIQIESSRSNTTSPNSDKETLERAESLQKHSISSQGRAFQTPSPDSGVPLQSHSHFNSHQSIPIRSTASTPCQGPGFVGIRKNLTVPRNWLSQSAGNIPARRHSSSSNYWTSVVDDGSGALTMVTEV